jgi:hypothetical protein
MISNELRRSLELIAAFLFLAVLAPAFTSAAPVGITITPLKYVIEAKPGERIVKEVTVINPNDFGLKVKPEFQDFKVAEDNTIQWIPADVENPYKMTDWILLDQSEITLKPKGERKLPFSIYVPSNARPGGHYAAVFFTAVMDETTTGVGSVPRVGALIILNVAGDVKKTGELVNFSGPLFVGSGPVNFKFTMLNTGTTHFETGGTITLTNIFGQKTVINSEKKFLYPGIKRDILAQWDKKTPIGIFWVRANIGDGEGNQFSKSKVMVALPFRYFLPALAALIVIILAWRVLGRKFKIVRV